MNTPIEIGRDKRKTGPVIRSIRTMDECIEFVRGFHGDAQFLDPMLTNEEQFQTNLVKCVEHPDRHCALGVYLGEQSIGLFTFLVLPEEQYLEMLVGLSRDRRAYAEILCYLERHYPGYSADFVFNPRNHLFCYQLGYLRKGKERLNISLNTLRPALTQYNQLAKDIRDKTKERRSLLSEKKALSAVHVFRNRELAAKIAALTEDQEELRSEKNLLLASLAYTEEDAADKFPKDIAAMEQNLKRLEEQEQKYSAELDEALKQYVELKEQATGIESAELMDAQLAIREEKERTAVDRMKAAYGEKYDPMMMHDIKRDVANMLNEEVIVRPIRERLHQKQKHQTQQRIWQSLGLFFLIFTSVLP